MNKQNPHTESLKGKIDWSTAVIPFVLIAFLCISFMAAPDGSRQILDKIRVLLGDTFGLYYLVIGLGVFLLSIYLAFSRYGSIRLGGPNEKPKYSDFAWSSMMFTAGLAADILFYSFCEWILYANDPHIAEMGSMQIWSSTYPIFHWGPIPWSFYLVLAVAFGFMLHVRGCHKQKYSEACRPILGNRVDKLPGKCIDLLALFALLAGTATTFSLATPLMAQVLSRLTGLPSSKWVTIGILVVTCIIYTYALVHGMKGISRLSAACMYLFFALLAYVLLAGGETRYILETGFSAIGNLAQNFFSLATFTDPQRTTSFPQTWTIFYWAYWMVWCVASLLHRLHLPWAHREADHPGRLCIQPGRHLLKLPDPGKLQPGPPGQRKAGRSGDLWQRGRPVLHHHCHCGYPPPGSHGAGTSDRRHDRLLRHQLRFHRPGSLLLHL